jgi:hypothetical protein
MDLFNKQPLAVMSAQRQFVQQAALGGINARFMQSIDNGRLLKGMDWDSIASTIGKSSHTSVENAQCIDCIFDSISAKCVYFNRVKMQKTTFDKCKFRCVFSESEVVECHFTQSNIGPSLFSTTTSVAATSYNNVSFTKCSMQGSHFGFCTIDNVHIINCNIRGMRIVSNVINNLTIRGKAHRLWLCSLDILTSKTDRRKGVPHIDLSEALISDIVVQGDYDLSRVVMPSDNHARVYVDWMKSARLRVLDAEKSARSDDERLDWQRVLGNWFNQNNGQWNILVDRDVLDLHPVVGKRFLDIVSLFRRDK